MLKYAFIIEDTLMQMTILHCFCSDTPMSGNPCGVIQHFLGTPAEKQQLANQLNLPVLVFISHHDDDTPILEYFYPGTQMPLCIHGTLGAASILFDPYQIQPLKCMTASGIPLSIYFDNDVIQVSLGICQKPIDFLDTHEICQMLDLKSDALLSATLPCKIASVGSPKLLIPVISKAVLMNLQADFSHIHAWSIDNQVNGIYVYVQDPGEKHSFYARGFNPKTGHHEDAATGVAAGALATCFDMKHISIKQGEVLGKPSIIHVVRRDEANVLVGGKVIVIQSNIEVDRLLAP